MITAQKGKKYGLVVSGNNFGAGAQLLVNGTPLELVSSTSTELEGRFTNPMLRQPGTLNIQVRTADSKTSNIVTIAVAAQ